MFFINNKNILKIIIKYFSWFDIQKVNQDSNEKKSFKDSSNRKEFSAELKIKNYPDREIVKDWIRLDIIATDINTETNDRFVKSKC